MLLIVVASFQQVFPNEKFFCDWYTSLHYKDGKQMNFWKHMLIIIISNSDY